MKGKLMIVAALLCTLNCAEASAQEQGDYKDDYSRWALSSNIPSWLLLGTINGDIHWSTGRHWSLQAGVKYNPFTYARGSENQTHLRQFTPSLGLRHWHQKPFEGWFSGIKLLYSTYSVANIAGLGFFDGNLAALALTGGWNKPLRQNLSLSLGAGIAAGLHSSTSYMGPVCGRITGNSRGIVVFIPDLYISIYYLL